METIAQILLFSAAPIVVTIISLVNAKKINADWRERRAARLAERS